MNRSLAADGSAIQLFLAFALAYFFSALLRAVTATLAPAFTAELGLGASDLGLLAGAYFLGFASLQLPLGSALDRVGPKRVLLILMVLAVTGCVAFAWAESLPGLVLARVLTGMGVAACLMAPLTCFRARFSVAIQLRTNSWMLMTGSLGMLASTLPVQWLLPVLGWRGLFLAIAGCLVLAMGLVWAWVPRHSAYAAAPDGAAVGYGSIVGHPIFLRSMPIGFFIYGGLIAMQSLWAGPWLTRVAGASPAAAAGGLFLINLCMLAAFLGWGLLMPRLSARGVVPHQLMAWGLPASLALMALIVLRPEPAGAWLWAAWCVSSTFVSLSQPAVGQAFPPHAAGRALSAFNLVIFSGVFCIQWGMGVLVDGFRNAGVSETSAFRSALGCFGGCCVLSYLWFVHASVRWRAAA